MHRRYNKLFILSVLCRASFWFQTDRFQPYVQGCLTCTRAIIWAITRLPQPQEATLKNIGKLISRIHKRWEGSNKKKDKSVCIFKRSTRDILGRRERFKGLLVHDQLYYHRFLQRKEHGEILHTFCGIFLLIYALTSNYFLFFCITTNNIEWMS